MLAILFYIIGTQSLTESYALRVAGLALLATLVGTAATLLALNALLKPLGYVRAMLGEYRHSRRLLPPTVRLADEMGELLSGTAETLAELDGYIEDVRQRDPDTGGLNAHGLKRALACALRDGAARPVLVQIQLREFADIEVALGHAAAGFVSRTVLDRIRYEVADAAGVAALGRGRFGVLVTGIDSERLQLQLERLAAGSRRRWRCRIAAWSWTVL